jgi:hypothetical protein
LVFLSTVPSPLSFHGAYAFDCDAAMASPCLWLLFGQTLQNPPMILSLTAIHDQHLAVHHNVL